MMLCAFPMEQQNVAMIPVNSKFLVVFKLIYSIQIKQLDLRYDTTALTEQMELMMFNVIQATPTIPALN